MLCRVALSEDLSEKLHHTSKKPEFLYKRIAISLAEIRNKYQVTMYHKRIVEKKIPFCLLKINYPHYLVRTVRNKWEHFRKEKRIQKIGSTHVRLSHTVLPLRVQRESNKERTQHRTKCRNKVQRERCVRLIS